MRTQSALGTPCVQHTVQHNGGLTTGLAPDFAQSPSHGHAHAQTNRFAEGFFDRETGGQKAHTAVWPACGSRSKGVHFGVAQNLHGKAFAMPFPSSTDTAYVTNIGANAKNLAHGDKQAK
jgi:hypothetical protein